MAKLTFTTPFTAVQFGIVFRLMRESAKLTQKEMAAKIGTSQGRLAQLENGKAGEIFDQLSIGGEVTHHRITFILEELP